MQRLIGGGSISCALPTKPPRPLYMMHLCTCLVSSTHDNFVYLYTTFIYKYLFFKKISKYFLIGSNLKYLKSTTFFYVFSLKLDCYLKLNCCVMFIITIYYVESFYLINKKIKVKLSYIIINFGIIQVNIEDNSCLK